MFDEGPKFSLEDESSCICNITPRFGHTSGHTSGQNSGQNSVVYSESVA